MRDPLSRIERLDGVLAYLAKRMPAADAIIYASGSGAGQRHTWLELDQAADAVGAYLSSQGIAQGDRCAVFLEHGFSVLACVYGIMRVGGIVVPVDPKWGRRSVSSILSHARISVAIGSDRSFFDTLGVPVQFFPYGCLPLRREDPTPLPRRDDPDEVALLAFTSGTTSEPKGVVITHRQIRFAYNLGRKQLALSHPQRFGCFFRLSGLGILGVCFLFAAAHGATTVVFGELDVNGAKKFWRYCEEWQIDFAYLVPAVVQLINRLARPAVGGTRRPIFACAAAPLTREALDTFQGKFETTLLNIYGLTELSFAIMFGARNKAGRGRLTIGDGGLIETRLVHRDGSVVDGAGEGELQIRSPSACSGYWDNPTASAALFEDGWLKTGDIARRDASGSYYIVGRAKDVVIHGGFNIHLSDVDEVLLAHEDVLAAASIGVPDRLYGEKVVAAVRLRQTNNGIDPILDWCRTELGINRAPKQLFEVDAIPINGAGKVVRRHVHDLIESALANG